MVPDSKRLRHFDGYMKIVSLGCTKLNQTCDLLRPTMRRPLIRTLVSGQDLRDDSAMNVS